MYLLNGTMSNMLCCFGVRDQDGSDRPATLRNLPNTSTTSMTMPTATIPHVTSTSEELRKIFASDTTPGGYNAAANAPLKRIQPKGSLDLSFQFGTPTYDKKSNSRIEQITKHIKQKLSESGLSRKNSKDETTTAELGSLTIPIRSAADESTELLSASHRSTGLTDLLTLRARSEGGYDSDARSIQTPMIHSNAGTIRVSPCPIRKSLRTVQSEGAAELVSQPPYPKTTSDIVSGPKGVEPVSTSAPSTPTGVSFAAARRIRVGESPGDALRRVNLGLVNGTVKLPDTPELRAVRMASTDQGNVEWVLSMNTPRNDAGLVDRSSTIDDTMKALNSRIEAARRSSPGLLESYQRDSLISELDPVLIEYIERYSNGHELDLRASTSSSPSAGKIGSTRRNELQGLSSTAGSLDNSVKGISSATTSAEHSIHLFNMRISQQLASESRIHVLSTSSSNHTSSRSLASSPKLHNEEGKRAASVGRYPLFIAIEQNRRPSDPKTRQLFEDASSGLSMLLVSRSPTVKNNPPILTNIEKKRFSRDDASHFSSSEASGLRNTSATSPAARYNLANNFHSLAIGGRSVSEAAPNRHVNGSHSYLSSSAEAKESSNHAADGSWETTNSWDSRTAPSQRSRSVSVPRTRKPFRLHVGGRQQQTTEDNELMSEVSVQAAQDRKNERFSEIGRSMASISTSTQSVTTQISDEWVNEGQRNSSGFDSINKKTHVQATPKTVGGPTSTATTKTATNDLNPHNESKDRSSPGIESLLTTPTTNRASKLDRRFSIRSTSDYGPSTTLLSEPTFQKRSHSASGDRCSTTQDLKEKQHRKSMPLLTFITDSPISRKAQTWVARGKSHRRNLLGLGLQFTAAGVSEDEQTPPEAGPPNRNLGFWASFPSHTREERNGSAGEIDGVHAQDFQDQNHNISTVPVGEMSANRSTASVGLQAPNPWTFLGKSKARMRRSNTKSMSFAVELEERAKNNNKGLLDRLRHLYRSHSSEMRAFTGTYGHRSSISAGSEPEYPELEVLPGGDDFNTIPFNCVVTSTDLDGTIDKRAGSVSEATSRSEYSSRSKTNNGPPVWTGMYDDCVGSLSALRSDPNSGRSSGDTNGRLLGLDSALRDSTVDFQTALAKEAVEVKADLLRYLQQSESFDSSKNLVAGIRKKSFDVRMQKKSAELKMPGSFE